MTTSTTPQPREQDNETAQTSHDEPLVIDNGPIELDFGEENEVQEVAGTWRRVRARFGHLLVLQTKPNGDIDLFRDEDLDPTQPLTFHLGTQPDPEVDSISFNVRADDQNRTVIMNPGGISFVKTERRKLKPNGGPPLRISRIQNGTKFVIDLREGAGFRSNRVSAILY